MSQKTEILQRFRGLSVWKKRGQRAPHKPLLCLLAISDLLKGKERLIPFSAVEEPLSTLLHAFGPPRKVCHPEYPFWALQNEEGIWEVRNGPSPSKSSNYSPTKAALLRHASIGGFATDVFQALKNDPALAHQIIQELLHSNFPETLHEDILLALGLPFDQQETNESGRDPQFREKILSAYEYRCAVCRFSLRLGHVVIALEAAHIKWHQAGGPDTHQNGLALCSLHHKLLDTGAFTIDRHHRILVSEKAYGSEGFLEHLGRYHRQQLLMPIREAYSPKREFLAWHLSQVFRSPSRE